MRKLNFGCGARYVSAKEWTNVDFNATSDEVIQHNLLTTWPFPSSSFGAVYSSHVVEHFQPADTAFLLKETLRVLVPGGVTRIVIPDLEQSAREYLRVLEAVRNNREPSWKHEWVTIELIDQLVRTERGGQMGIFYRDTVARQDRERAEYVRRRTGENLLTSLGEPTSSAVGGSRERPKRTLNYLKTRVRARYIDAVTSLLPKDLRSILMDRCDIGEKHRWMYDDVSIAALLRRAGFEDIQFQDATRSQISHLADDLLDVNEDGTPYKECSLYCEARKPG